MPNWNFKTWVIVLVIAVGGSFEIIKRLPSSPSTFLETENARANNVSVPYSVRNNYQLPQPPTRVAGKTLPRLTPEQLAALQGQSNSATFAHEKGAEGTTTAKVDDKKKKKKDDDEWEIVVDPKTGKRIKRRKKKKPVLTPPQEEVAKKEDTKDDKKDNDVDAAIADSLSTGMVTPPAPLEEDNNTLNSIEEWIRRLLNRPDLDETKRFVDAFYSNLVTADVFYKVVNLMLQDSRVEMKKHGVLALGLTPSVNSFTHLANVHKNERNDSALRPVVQGYLNSYSTLSNLHILERVMKSSADSHITVLATQRLDAAAKHLLNPKLKPPTNPTGGSTTTHTNARYFQKFLAILDQLTKSPDSSVTQQAQSTLSSLQSLLGSTNPNA